jgi:proton-dependent oligopeptide transporter, POT family
MNRPDKPQDAAGRPAAKDRPYRAGTAGSETVGRFRTVPEDIAGMPSGVPYIIGNEAAERFSFYGMRSILVIFMTKYLLDRSGNLDLMGGNEATAYYHSFVSAVYFLPLLGALLSDAVLGKYRTIMYLSVVYCLGHLALAIDATRLGLAVGLTLIAFGSGGIKPCVSANVGDQFGPRNQHLLEKVFGWFYFSINFGSSFAQVLIPALLNNPKYGPHVAFAVPGVLMAVATLCFWLGRHKFVHVPAGGLGFLKEALTPEGLKALGRLAVVAVFVAMFWALYDQNGSSWVLQAEDMNRTIPGYEHFPSWIKNYVGPEVLAAQVPTINPILILVLIPVFSYGIYPAINRVYRLTALRKISIGFFLTMLSFVVVAMIEHAIAAGQRPSIGWQLLAFLLLTSGEVMVSITGLEYSYTQAPKSMKSIVMALWLLAVSLGNGFTAAVNFVLEARGHVVKEGAQRVPDPEYFWFFAGIMLLWAIVFLFVAPRLGTQAKPEAGANDN